MSEKEYRPFPNGASFRMFMAHNCERCKKGPSPDLIGSNESCEIENTLALASCLDGTMFLCGENSKEKVEELARRLNWDGVDYIENNCPEFEPIAAAATKEGGRE